ncbi:MAG: hypothetical protein ABMA13_15440 [Chthoniobacteraceae bacterium]
MRKLLLAVVLSGVPVFVHAENDTAYKALRVLGKQQGEKTLNRVVELRGRSGAPQPQVWKIIASDPTARGGLIEVEVQRGRIISQRTPTGRSSATMDLNQLNLDSDGAFTIADQELRKEGIPFDRIDYLLRSSAQQQPPTWQLELFDRGNKVATFRIAADTGTVIDRQRLIGPPRDRDYVDRGSEPNRGSEPHRSNDSRWSESGEPIRGVDDFFHRLGKRFERRGNQLKRFFGGD